MNVRKSKIVKVGYTQSSSGISSEGPKEVDMARLKSPYEQLGDVVDERGGHIDVVRDMGKKRTVDIEMAPWDQVNAKSRVASMV